MTYHSPQTQPITCTRNYAIQKKLPLWIRVGRVWHLDSLLFIINFTSGIYLWKDQFIFSMYRDHRISWNIFEGFYTQMHIFQYSSPLMKTLIWTLYTDDQRRINVILRIEYHIQVFKMNFFHSIQWLQIDQCTTNWIIFHKKH